MSTSYEFEFYDPRYEDLYIVECRDGRFLSALRYLGGRVGPNPIHYLKFNEVPEPHRHEIENLIRKKCRTTN